VLCESQVAAGDWPYSSHIEFKTTRGLMILVASLTVRKHTRIFLALPLLCRSISGVKFESIPRLTERITKNHTNIMRDSPWEARAANQNAFKQRYDWIVNATGDASHCARKTIGPIKDSAIEWVSFESIEIVMALGSSGNSPNIFA
jgi:hypothetical protein